MKATVWPEFDGAIIEVEPEDGYHAGLTVSVSFSEEDGAPIVQIDTPPDTETHDLVRVYVNDAIATRWEAP